MGDDTLRQHLDFTMPEDRLTEPSALLLYFGKPWAGLKEQNAVRVSAPVGESCLVCSERIVAGDRGYVRATLTDSGWRTRTVAVHIECEALGIVGHTFGVCSCTGFDTTSRASARVLWERISDFTLSTGVDQ